MTASYLILRRITQSPFGMVLQSIRENEARTRAIGYPVERYKIVAVMLSGLFAGLAGVLYAVQNQFAAPDFVFFLISGEVVIFNVMGGIGTLVGPIVGAAFFLVCARASRASSDRVSLPDSRSASSSSSWSSSCPRACSASPSAGSTARADAAHTRVRSANRHQRRASSRRCSSSSRTVPTSSNKAPRSASMRPLISRRRDGSPASRTAIST